MIRVEYISSSKEILGNRLYALNQMINAKHKVFIITPSSLYRFYPTKEEFLDSSLHLKINQIIEPNELINKLIKNGYYRVSKIDQSLEFANRGDIIDVFSINYENPIRIEFFDDEIESIRFFDIATQRSLEEINEIDILPATSLIFNQIEKENIRKLLTERLELDLTKTRDDLKPILKAEIEEVILDLESSNFSQKHYKYYGYLKTSKVNLLSYLSSFKSIMLEKDEFLKAKDRLFEESHDFLVDLFESGRSLTHLELFKETSYIDKAKNIEYVSSMQGFKDATFIRLSSPFLKNKGDVELSAIVDLYKNEFKKLVFVVKTNEQYQELVAVLNFYKLDFQELKSINDKFNKPISILKSDFSLSLEDRDNNFAIVDSSIIFNKKRTNNVYTSKFKQGNILGSYDELESGDFVVHEKYGIGRFVGIEQMTVGEKTDDYLQIEYKDKEYLYVPLYNFSLLRKYVGKEGRVPSLSSLHSDKWNKTKKKIKEKINLLADKLLVLYQNKNNIKGFAFPKDDEISELFENNFHHDLTEDQQKSIEEIKKDMESEHPMDRLLCGDVGFGKTEVAFRAAFKAIAANKQVALLAPTTLLAKQHYEVALERFKNFDIKIKLLTRFQTAKEIKDIEEKLSRGNINMLIGTHKVLNSKLKFKDLGLLIIDEEQRFGVEQKEKIHMLKPDIDILTLSATPIPRTLQSSLIGLKSVSTIQTPPKERLPVQTYVLEKDYKVIKEIIERELARNGQIYYIHNDIFSIYELGSKLLELIPQLKIGIIHGKMDREEINDVMISFYTGEIDLLLATTIIENGIDVRNANLILVDEANRFGLAQLYQIKGRVGRGNRMAFCYLFISREKKLTEESQKRLKAIQDFTELGSGFKIAQRDLLIRGAGDILGPQQAGFIDEVGIDMYIKLLNEAIAEKENKVIIKKEEKETSGIINNAYIPKDFTSQSDKIEIYQKIKEADDLLKLHDLRLYIKDLYGDIPSNIENLLMQRKIDIYISMKEFDNIKDLPNHIDIYLSKEFTNIEGIGNILFERLVNYLKYIKVTYLNRQLVIALKKDDGYLEKLFKIFEIIHEEGLKNEIG